MAGPVGGGEPGSLEAEVGVYDRFVLPPPVVVRDLRRDDVAAMTWALGEDRSRTLNDSLRRAGAGEVVYLVAELDGEGVVGHLGVDLSFAESRSPLRPRRRQSDPQSAYLWQFGVREDLQSRGIGTRMLGAAERIVSGRGLSVAQIAVAKDNPRARALYERLGYVVIGSEIGRWTTVREGREVEVVEEEWMLRKQLA